MGDSPGQPKTGICLAHSTQLVTYVIVGNDRLGSRPGLTRVFIHLLQLFSGYKQQYKKMDGDGLCFCSSVTDNIESDLKKREKNNYN